jgi:hypothetical protein
MTTKVYYGWKLFRQMKSGAIRSLFIDKAHDLPIGAWLKAKNVPTKGFAVRPGWHATSEPIAPHLKTEGRVWRRVALRGVSEIKRPESQGGTWWLAKEMYVFPSGND